MRAELKRNCASFKKKIADYFFSFEKICFEKKQSEREHLRKKSLTIFSERVKFLGACGRLGVLGGLRPPPPRQKGGRGKIFFQKNSNRKGGDTPPFLKYKRRNFAEVEAAKFCAAKLKLVQLRQNFAAGIDNILGYAKMKM